MVRWEVSYEGKSFQKKLEIWPDPKFRKMPQIGQGGPPRHPKNNKNGPKRAPAQFGAQGPCITPDPPALAGPYVILLGFAPQTRLNSGRRGPQDWLKSWGVDPKGG